MGLALVVAVLVVVESYLSWTGIYGHLPRPGEPFDLTWTLGVQIGIGIALGVAIGVLVIIALVTAILGAVAWRRGVLAMVAASPEFGTDQVASCRKAREDHSTTLWLFLVLVLAAVVVSVAFAGINGTLAVLGVGTVPGTVGSIATGLATGTVLVVIYSFGTRHLVELLSAVATPREKASLLRGRSRMIAGAIVGLGAAFAPASWAFNAFAVVSLAVILTGVVDLATAYDLWLAEHPRTLAVPRSSGPAPA